MRSFNFQIISMVTLLFILGLFCSKSGGGSGREINSEQLQKRGDGLFYAVNEEKPYSGKVVELYKSGQKKIEQTFSNGKLHGLTTSWNSDGQKEEETSYQNGAQTGPYRTWYDNGQQKSEGVYKEGKEEGKWTFWTRNGEKIETGITTDIDKNEYKTVKIDNQWWMAENLKVTHYRNGDAIPNVTNNSEWAELTSGAYCYYDNNSSYAADYGALYNWYAVNDSRNIALTGWHVPTYAEWQALVDYLGGEEIAGGKLKETGIMHWESPNTGATNEYRFTARSCGVREDVTGYFTDMGEDAFFWSATEFDFNHLNAWAYWVYNDNVRGKSQLDFKKSGFSIRLVRD